MGLNRWLLVVFYLGLIVAFSMKCKRQCFIEDLRPDTDGTFMFRYFPATEKSATFSNLLAIVVKKDFMDKIGAIMPGIVIENSPVVERIHISEQCSLKALLVKHSRLKSITIEGTSRLIFLQISDSLMRQVPPTIRYLQAAKVIDIHESQIVTLDLAPFCSTTSLWALKLEKNKIRYIINSSPVACNPIMEMLNLGNNRMEVLNLELLSTCSRLHFAEFNQNRIEIVVGHFTSTSLRSLSLFGNLIKRVDCCQWNLPALTYFTIGSNMLTEVPRCLSNLSHLENLLLHRNHFTHFDLNSVANLSRLQSLHLGLNNISTFILNSQNFPASLTLLYLSYNRLDSLDLSYVPVPRLELYASDNLISKLVIENVSQSVSLLKLKNNPIDCSWSSPEKRKGVKCKKNTNFIQEQAYDGNGSKVLGSL